MFQSREEEAESIIRWAAGRAAVVVLVPIVGAAAALANQIYMVNRLGQLHQVDLTISSVKGFVTAFAGAIAGQTLSALVPLPFLQVPVAVTVTYGVGKAADHWLRDGMPAEYDKYKTVFSRARDFAKQNLADLLKDPRKDSPLGDEKRKF